MTAAPAPAEVVQALAEVSGQDNRDLRKKAERSLLEWSKKDPTIQLNEQSVQLWIALNHLLSGKNEKARVSMKLFQSCGTTVKTSSALKQLLWAVPKHMMKRIPEKFSGKLIAPGSLQDVPPGTKVDDFHFFDQAVSRSDLPVGTLVLECALSSERSIDGKGLEHSALEQAMLELDLPESTPVEASAAPVPQAVTASTQSAGASERQLQRHSSDETDETKVAWQMAIEIGQCLQDKRVSLKDGRNFSLMQSSCLTVSICIYTIHNVYKYIFIYIYTFCIL